MWSSYQSWESRPSGRTWIESGEPTTVPVLTSAVLTPSVRDRLDQVRRKHWRAIERRLHGETRRQEFIRYLIRMGRLSG